MDVMFTAFFDELQKLAARVPFLHGTNGSWDTLKAGIGSTVLKNDPNPRAVYVTLKNRQLEATAKGFAGQAAAAKGGTAQVAHGKMDTKKGWQPSGLTAWGRKHFEGGLEEAQDVARELDIEKDKKKRGKLWEQLQRGTGAWTNQDPSATLKPSRYKPVV